MSESLSRFLLLLLAGMVALLVGAVIAVSAGLGYLGYSALDRPAPLGEVHASLSRIEGQQRLLLDGQEAASKAHQAAHTDLLDAIKTLGGKRTGAAQ